MPFPAAGQLPGMKAIVEETPRDIIWDKEARQIQQGANVLDSTAVDAGNTPTTTLRDGLVLGRKTSDGLLYPWDPDGTDGTERYAGVLAQEISMLNESNTAVDKVARVLYAAAFKASGLLIQGTAFTSSTAEHLARRQMQAAGCYFDDELEQRANFLGPPINVKNVTGDTVVVAGDNGTLFVATTADVDFTLPTIEAGLVFEFLRASDHEMRILSAAGDDIIIGNDLSADSVTWTTAGQQIGALARVESIFVGTTLKWLIRYWNPPFGTGVTGGFTIAVAT